MNEVLVTEEWTKEQVEIWENVHKYTKQILYGDWKKAIRFFHSEYSGWNSGGLIPATKTDIINEFQKKGTKKILSYSLTPISINIFSNVAIVNYFFSIEFKNNNGDNKIKRTRNMDILLRQKEGWILIGDYSEKCN